MSNKTLKVTDKRMFTPEGELREEFRHVPGEPAEESAQPPADAREPGGRSPEPPPERRPPERQPPERRPPEPAQPGPSAATASHESAEQGRPGAPGFFDLVGLLAEPASIYLREARNAPPQTASQSIELARLHIDLLAVLRDKTQGNLTPEENAMLEDVVYQLRSGFVGLRG